MLLTNTLIRRAVRFRMQTIVDHCRQLHQGDKSARPKRPYTIVVEGNIGAGKTTFLQDIKELSPPGLIEVIEEPVDEWQAYKDKFNLMDMMYQDPKKWSFLFQVQVQLSMMKKYKTPYSRPIRIMERSLLSARFCFVENLYNNGFLEDAELHMLNDLYNFVIEHDCFICQTDLIVYLRTSPETAYQRMLQRSRSKAEKALPYNQFVQIHELHEDWLFRKTKFQPLSSRVVVIDGDEELEKMRLNYDEYQKVLLEDLPNL
uniref:Deoxynucleoside kinase n=1 Tax=Lepeophtheirus salmonis TaxID=72036 RepID=C1BTP6_LEPSM|nr:Deoxynucleoside kinase [Lepeophtheirus salmonis]